MAIKSPARTAGAAHRVAVDLGAKLVRVVEVEQNGAGIQIVRRGTASLPRDVWNDVHLNIDAMAAAIREAIASAGISTRSVAACLPRRFVTVRFAQLPAAPPEQLRGMIEFEAQQHILFPVNEVMLDHRIITQPGSGAFPTADDMQTVLLAAARRSLVNDLVLVFDRAGLELQQLGVSALALAEHARDALEPTALIAVEPGALDVAVVADGQLLFTRSSALDISVLDPDVAGRKMSEEIARSFTAFQNEFRQKPLRHVLVCGGETLNREGEWITRTLTEALEIPVEPLQTRLLPQADPDARAYAVAAGTALQGLGDSLAGVNLVPNERAERRMQNRRKFQQYLVGAGVIAALAAGVVFLRGALSSQETLNGKTVAANRDLEDAQKQEKQIKVSHDRIAALNGVLTKQLDRAHPSVDVLVALNRAMPKSSEIWLTQMSFDRTGLLTLRGEAKTSRAVTDLLLNLQATGSFRDIKLGQMADAEETNTTASNTARPASTPTVVLPPLPGLTPAPAVNGRVATTPNMGAPGVPMGNVPGMNPMQAGTNPNPTGSPGGPFPTANTPGGNPPFPSGNPTPVGSAPLPVQGPLPAPGGPPPFGVQRGTTGGPEMLAALIGQAGVAQPGQVQPGAPQFTPPTGQPAGQTFVPPGGDPTGNGGFQRRRRFGRNGVTGGPEASSINTGGALPNNPVPSNTAGPVSPAMPAQPAPATTAPAGTVVRPKTRVQPVKPAKMVLTSFVITCRLKPDAVLIRPEKQVSAPASDKSSTVVRKRANSSQGDAAEANTAGDTGDDIE